MTRYIAKRLIQGVITMWLVTLLVFGMLRITGNPVDFLAPPDMPHQGRTYLKKVYGLDEPAWKQYLLFNKGIFTGDFGRSFSGTQQPALEVFWARFPATMQLAGAALLFSIVAGVGIGVVSATRPESIFDRVGKIVAITGQAMPVYWLGLLLILLFVVYLRWLPTGGGLDRLGPKGLILPSFALGWAFVAAHTRIVRSSMLEVLESDYIKMVRAKGMPKRIVIWKHALKNASIPVFTLFAVNFASIVSGAVITEVIFTWPGVGSLLVESILSRDYAVVQTVVFFTALMVVVVNLLVDLVYGWLDPRIRTA